jgi:hypothetical protein
MNLISIMLYYQVDGVFETNTNSHEQQWRYLKDDQSTTGVVQDKHYI